VLALFSLEKAPRRLYCGLSILIRRGLMMKMEKDFLPEPVVTGQGVMVLN